MTFIPSETVVLQKMANWQPGKARFEFARDKFSITHKTRNLYHKLCFKHWSQPQDKYPEDYNLHEKCATFDAHVTRMCER